MFYSHTFLARKGPLGTVWCAAHLQHRLKKSHYTSTNIPSTVERIMYPEVPIALRMSGHLLLGVVRIYSKQVDYLYQDCNGALIGIRKAFSSVNVNLPEDATQAPFHSVTLPERFQLDALELEDDNFLERGEDDHLKTQEEITLEDQIPTGTDPYIVITFDEEIRSGSPVLKDASGSGVQPIEEDGHPSVLEDTAAFMGDPSPGNQTELNEKPVGDSTTNVFLETEILQNSTTEVLPETEILRDSTTEVLRETEILRDTTEGLQRTEILRDSTTEVLTQTELMQASTTEVLPRTELMQDSTTEVLPEIEIMRDAVHDFHMEGVPIWPDKRYDIMEPDRVLEEQIMRDKETKSPVFEEMLHSVDSTIPVHRPEEPQSVASEKLQENFDLPIDFGHAMPELALRASPPVEKPRAKQKKRRRQFYDESTVLTNKSMKKALEDSRDLLRKKRDCPASNLDIWKLNKRLKKDSIFFEPLLTGLSTDLHSVFEREVFSSKPHLIISEEAHPETEVIQSPTYRSHNEEEIEHLRGFEGPTGNNSMLEILPSPGRLGSSPITSMPSLLRKDEATPSTMNLGSDMDRLETTVGTDVLPTPDRATSSGLFGFDTEFSANLFSEARGGEDSVLSDIPEMANSAGELSFLEQDDNTPAGFQGTPDSGQLKRNRTGTQEFDKLSARTRAVAQYLKRQSSVTPNSEGSGGLSLNRILEGKSRKICARMFSEMLVLKNCGLVDVNQEAPYDNITLMATSKLSKEQFSS